MVLKLERICTSGNLSSAGLSHYAFSDAGPAHVVYVCVFWSGSPYLWQKDFLTYLQFLKLCPNITQFQHPGEFDSSPSWKLLSRLPCWPLIKLTCLPLRLEGKRELSFVTSIVASQRHKVLQDSLVTYLAKYTRNESGMHLLTR